MPSLRCGCSLCKEVEKYIKEFKRMLVNRTIKQRMKLLRYARQFRRCTDGIVTVNIDFIDIDFCGTTNEEED